MSGFWFQSVDPFRVIDFIRQQGGGTRTDSVCRCIEVALELGLFHRAKYFYCFQQFESDSIEFGVHQFYSGHDPLTGEFPADAVFIEFVGCGGKPHQQSSVMASAVFSGGALRVNAFMDAALQSPFWTGITMSVHRET